MAKAWMEETCKLHDGHDGSAEFFLKTIREIEREGMPKEWSGVIEFAKK
jgi:hypothetical protein